MPLRQITNTVWIWQLSVSPHMAGLAKALAAEGLGVIYVAEQRVSHARKMQGWDMPDLGNAELRIVGSQSAISDLVRSATSDSVHITQGLRRNGYISIAQRLLGGRNLRQWAIFETVRDDGPTGLIKRVLYRYIIARARSSFEGFLTIGHATKAWAISRGAPRAMVSSFAYFLPECETAKSQGKLAPAPFRFIFAGQMIPLKRLGMLIDCLGKIDSTDFELAVVGSGRLDKDLKEMAETILGKNRVSWFGKVNMPEARELMNASDCLVLPSIHDGWGAVISEALLAGTPVICSDSCGAAGAVIASKRGGVFTKNDCDTLRSLLLKQLALGRVTSVNRRSLATWSLSLGATAGARYLIEILAHKQSSGADIVEPWNRCL